MKKLLLSALLFGGLLSQANAQLEDGSIAPNFTVTAYQPWLSTAGANGNGTYTLYDYLDQGYTVILDVSATWCGPCWNYHLTGALDDAYINHGPTGYPGVSVNTTNKLMVIWVEGDGQTADATMLDGQGSIGNWIEPNTTLGQIKFPMANPASNIATQINNGYEIAYFPTVYRICPNRTVTEIGAATATAIVNGLGQCPSPASEPIDVAALKYKGETVHCEGSYTPKVQIQNNGTTPLTSATISISQGGNVVSTGTYTGNLATYGVATVDCSPIANFQGGALSITVSTGDDAVSTNNALSANISLAANAVSQFVTIHIVTDAYGTETTWKLKNSNGTVVQQGGPYSDLTAAGTTTQPVVSAELNPTECYTFEILDEYGDGMCCQYGNGSYAVKDANGTNLVTGSEFADIAKGAFKTGVLNVSESSFTAFNVFPNPATESVNVVFDAISSDFQIQLVDITGRLMNKQVLSGVSGTQTVTFPVSNLAKGSYIVKIVGEGYTATRNVVVK